MEGYVLAIVILAGLFFILPKRIDVGSTGKDLLQLDYTLTYADREKIHDKDIFCSACESSVRLSFLRRKEDQPLEHATCLPCFLRNYTNVDQEDIDRLVQIAEKHGWYKKD